MLELWNWLWTGLAPDAVLAIGPLGVLGIASALGLIKSFAIDQPREARERTLAAKTAEFSPFTGLAPQQVQEADPFGTALQFGLGGFDIGQQAQAQQNQNLIIEQLLAGRGGAGAAGGSATSTVAPGTASPFLVP